jgi:hypothetical protein
MDPVLGYFIFVNLGDGCLGSKYGTIINTLLLSESATKIQSSDPNDFYLGLYASTWLNAIHPDSQESSFLTIERKAYSLVQYVLTWHLDRDSHTRRIYYGEGMRCESGLIGAYWNETIEGIVHPLSNIQHNV